ncbi:MAG: S41 family peptidase [Saprospiraceae bacterium]|nr:S41 family peptidase [Saprospiraceae bacterium]
MKNTTIIIATFFILFLSSACEKQIFGLEHSNDPLGNFDALWEEYNQLYGLFRLKGIDWDALRSEYRPRLSDESTDAELYQVLIEMLDHLNDGHVGLIPVETDLPSYFGGTFGSLDTMADFDLDILTENYLTDPRETDFAMRYDFVADNIGYVHIDNFADGEKAFDKEIVPVLDFFQSADGLIIDVRGAGGGEDIAGKTIASYFTDQERLYMTTTIKNGPGPEDFTTPEQWFISPRGDRRFLKPVVLLTNRFTISARETFCLAMRTLPQVTTVGDTTAGAFSNQINREMPNGWGYSVSIGEWRTADGASFEGQGIPPQVLVRNKRADVLNGKDEVLEKAIELLQ